MNYWKANPGWPAAVLLQVVLLSCGCAAQEAGTAADQRLALLQGRIEAKLAVFREEFGFPGAVAAFVLPDGTAGAAAVGVSDRETGRALTVRDRILSGSIGKTYVAAVALQMAGEKKLDLDAPISRWLGGEEWFGRLPNGTDITVRMLMNHTSGIAEHVQVPEFGRQVGADPDRVWRPEELAAFVLDREPLFAAGKGWSYADTNYIVLGMILERIAGRTFYEELQHRILDPLRLEDTVPAVSRTVPGLVPGYAGEFTPFQKSGKTIEDGRFRINPQVEWTGGGLACTTLDLARWGAILFQGRAFPPELMTEYLEGVPAFTGPGDRYGLGVQIWKGEHGTCRGHAGWFPGYVSQLAHYPDCGLTVALQINTDQVPGASARLRSFTDGLVRVLMDECGEIDVLDEIDDGDGEDKRKGEASLSRPPLRFAFISD